jgi:hypothetical protein
MTLRNTVVVFLLCCAACTPLRPRVSLVPGASLKDYRVLVVRPVADETGAQFNLDVGDSLRQALVKRLRSHGRTVVPDVPEDSGASALVVTSALVGFKGIPMWLQVPSRGVTGCELRSVLRDSQTGQRIGEIAAAELTEEYTPLNVLVRCAHNMADEIDRQMRR